MLGLIILLFLFPYLYGMIFSYKKELKSVFVQIVIGLIIEFVIWTIISLIVLFVSRDFLSAVKIDSIVNFVLITLILIKNWKKILVSFNINGGWTYIKNRAFVVMIIIVLLQMLRVAFFQYGYGDNRVYVSIVNDMVNTNVFFPFNPETGIYQSDLSQIPTKYVLSSWYSFEAMLAKISAIKPLIIIYTVLPVVIILGMYIIWWELSGIFFKDNITKRSAFIISFALLTELRTEDVNDYILFWPTYGKNITASIVMPLFLLIWLYNCRERQRNYEVLLFLTMIAGCAASTMGLMMMPLEAGLLTGVEVIRNKKLERCMVYRFLLLMVPVLIYAYLFIR